VNLYRNTRGKLNGESRKEKYMCNLKSAILLKDRVFMPDYNDHTKMLMELGITDERKDPQFVRVELNPKNGDIFANVEKWSFLVDQDILPDWFVLEIDKQRMREAVKIWAKDHIFIDVNNLDLKNGTYYLKDCKNAHFDSSTSEHYGSSTSEHYGSSTSEHYDSSTSEHYGSSTSKHYHSSTSKHYHSSTSKHYHGSTSEHYDSSTSEHYHSSTSKHYRSSTS
jgi:hypothetical protein